MQFVSPGPGKIGALSIMLDAIPASRADVARHLGVTRRTLAHWEATDRCPRAVKVAIFTESGYGRDLVAVTYRNEADLHRALADCLRREVATLQARIARLETLGDFGSANDPIAQQIGPLPFGRLTSPAALAR